MSAYFLSLCCICIALDNGTGLVGNTHQTNIIMIITLNYTYIYTMQNYCLSFNIVKRQFPHYPKTMPIKFD